MIMIQPFWHSRYPGIVAQRSCIGRLFTCLIALLILWCNPLVAFADNKIKILSFNAENYFNGIAGKTIDFSQSRGPMSTAEYLVKRHAIVRLINHVDPDILVLQEIENDLNQQDPAIIDLLKALGRGKYQLLTAQPAYFGGDAITQFIAYKTQAGLMSKGELQSSAQIYSKWRPLLWQDFRFQSGDGEIAHLTVATSHLRSKRSTCGRDYQCTQQRLKQAKAFSRLLNQHQRNHASALLWLGDFNAMPHENSMQTLSAQQWQLLLTPPAYTYIYKGRKELIDNALWLPAPANDQIFMKPAATAWNINTQANKNLQQSASRLVSDHDPVIVELQLAR